MRGPPNDEPEVQFSQLCILTYSRFSWKNLSHVWVLGQKNLNFCVRGNPPRECIHIYIYIYMLNKQSAFVALVLV